MNNLLSTRFTRTDDGYGYSLDIFLYPYFSKQTVSLSSVPNLLANTLEERTKNTIEMNLYIRLPH
jgi:hypothetical protein